MKDIKLFVDCACSTPEHSLRFFVESETPDCVYVSTYLNQNLPWYHRVITAFKYIFGSNQGYGNFEETLMKRNDVNNLNQLLSKYTKLNDVYANCGSGFLTEEEINKALEG